MEVFNKEEFLNTKVGILAVECIKAWDKALEGEDTQTARICQAQWFAFSESIKQFCGVFYHFTCTDEYFGACTDDKNDWLYKEMRNIDEAKILKQDIGIYIKECIDELGRAFGRKDTHIQIMCMSEIYAISRFLEYLLGKHYIWINKADCCGLGVKKDNGHIEWFYKHDKRSDTE